MPTIRASRPGDLPMLLDIWREAVRATHHFLAPGDAAAIEVEVAERYLPHAALWVAADAADRPLGFMGVTGAHIDALFVDPGRHGQGIGTLLVRHAMREGGALTVDVNEQNGQAIGFYRHLGFRPEGRSALDGAGRPYPLLHLRMAP